MLASPTASVPTPLKKLATFVPARGHTYSSAQGKGRLWGPPEILGKESKMIRVPQEVYLNNAPYELAIFDLRYPCAWRLAR